MVKPNPAITELTKLQEDISHLLSELTDRISGEFYGSANHWSPNIDLSEDDAEIIVKAEVPGVPRANLQVIFRDGCLQVRGEKKESSHAGKVRYLCLERAYGKFYRTVYLTVAVDISTATAKLHNGVLTITLPKLSNRRNQEVVIPVEVS
jgi:HSP20 family protein